MNLDTLEKQYEKASSLLKALANEKRLLIVCNLCNGEKNVGELETIIGLSQSALSQHLARLRRDGIVDTRREAQTIFYSIKDPHVPKLLQTISDLFHTPPS